MCTTYQYQDFFVDSIILMGKQSWYGTCWYDPTSHSLLTYESLVQPVLVSLDALHLRLLLVVKEDGPTQVRREVGNGALVPEITVLNVSEVLAHCTY